MVTKELNIRTTTSGFASPAESYVDKKWEMKQDYITQKYTTSWDELPLVFVWVGCRIFPIEYPSKGVTKNKTHYNIVCPNVYDTEGYTYDKPT